MKRVSPRSGPSEPRPLRREMEDGRATYWTRGLARPPAVHGERVVYREGLAYRAWDPTRSKLAAALVRSYDGALPSPGEGWLYLGAASGTTASHVADLVGSSGAVYALEKSLRPFARLLRLSERYPNLLPVLGDARDPRSYLPIVPPVEGLYVDVAQPDQVAIALDNARWFLRPNGVLLIALKTSSMGRERSPRAHLDLALDALAEVGEVASSLSLEPLHKRHFFLEIHPSRRWLGRSVVEPTTPAEPLAGSRP